MSDYILRNKNTGEWVADIDRKKGKAVYSNSLEDAKVYDYNTAHRIEVSPDFEDITIMKVIDIAVEMERELKHLKPDDY